MRIYFKALLNLCGLMAVVGVMGVAHAEIRSTNPKDPYSIRYSKLENGSLMMELCGPKGCKPLGQISLKAESNELKSLRDEEKFLYYTKNVAKPLILITAPIMSGYSGYFEVKLLAPFAERHLPRLMSLLYGKFGQAATIKYLGLTYGGIAAFRSFHTAKWFMDEVIETPVHEVALKALSDKGISGELVHVDFSIEELAHHLQADLKTRENMKGEVPPGMDFNSQYELPL